MEKLLVKVNLDSDCDPELLEHIKRIPKRRRAEQIRKLAFRGLLKYSKNENDVIEPSIQHAEEAVSNTTDEKLLEEDIQTFNIK